MHSPFWFVPIVALTVGCAVARTGGAESVESDRHRPALDVREPGLVRVGFPEPDPGIPGYLRLTPLYDQYFHSGGWLAIPIYRTPDCIPVDFNLFDFFHPPSDAGPGAFACELRIRGSYLIEADAPWGTFPIVANASGDDVPFWFVRWSDFLPLKSRARMTIVELAALPSLIRGTATSFEEVIRPRDGGHHVAIDAQGVLEDGRQFSFHVTHVEDQTRNIRISFR